MFGCLGASAIEYATRGLQRVTFTKTKMAWDIRKTYYYLVCFAMLIMLIVGSVQVVQNGLDLVFPEEAYRPSAIDMHQRYLRPGGDTSEVTFTTRELEQMAEEESARIQRQMRHRVLRNLIGSLALIMISAPVYFYHWRKVREDERSSDTR